MRRRGRGKPERMKWHQSKQDACVLASTLTTGLNCAEDVHKLTVEQLGAILLSRNEKEPKGKAAMVETIVGCLGLPPVADGARSSYASPAPNVGTPASSFQHVPLLPDMSFPSFPMALDQFACAIHHLLLFCGCHYPSLCPSPVPTPMWLHMHWPACAPRPLSVACACREPALHRRRTNAFEDVFFNTFS